MNALLLALALGCPKDGAAPGGVPVKPSVSGADCVATWSTESGPTVLDEQRSFPGAVSWNDFATGYAPAAIDASFVPVKRTSSFVVDGAPVLYFTKDGAAVVTDARVFPDGLTSRDLVSGDTGAVGRIAPEARAKVGGRDLALFLIQADAIRTYAHIGSSGCLRSETEAEGAWTGVFEGSHVYFTNERNEQPLAFTVTIDASGAIAVAGR